MVRAETPVDQLSGIPLLIVPNDLVLGLLRGLECNENRIADWNHAYHPAAQVLAGGHGSEAVRNSRKQFVLRREHDAYHREWDGPPSLKTPSERFEAVVYCAAGYIPLQAMDVSGRCPKVVNLKEEQRERLRLSGEVRVASFSIVQKFIKGFVMEQPADHIQPKMIDRFLALDTGNVTDASEQKYLAHLLLSQVIDRVEEPLDRAYDFGHAYGLLTPGLPANSGDFIESVIVRSPKNMRNIARELIKKLVIYRDGPEAALGIGRLAVR